MLKDVDKWATRKLIYREFNITISNSDIIDKPTGFSIVTNGAIFTVFPPQGETPMDIAEDIVFQLREKYPELKL